MSKNRTIKEFLKDPVTQNHLTENRLDKVFDRFDRLIDDPHVLTNFLINDVGIEPLMYMEVIISNMYRNVNIPELFVPSTIVRFDDFAFSNCDRLKIIHIPKTVTSIGEYAFNNCVGLTDVYYDGESKDNIVIHRGNEKLLNATWHFEV